VRGRLAIALPARGGQSAYVVGGLRDVAESWRGELGDDLLNPDVFGGHDCGGGGRDLGVRGIVVVLWWTEAKLKNTSQMRAHVAAALAAFYGSQITRCRLDQTADNVHPVTLHLLSRRAHLHC
jgi:hypothetical protein